MKIAIQIKHNISLIGQLIRYCLVGALIYLSDFGIFSLIVFFNAQMYLEANIVGRIVGAVLGFLLHKKYTFADLKQSTGIYTQLVSYAVLFGLNTMLSVILLWGAVKVLTLNVLVSRLLIDVLIIAFSFVVSRFFIFKGEVR